MSVSICLIGCGVHATVAHGPSLHHLAREESGIVLSACCDLDAAKAEDFRRTFGFRRSYSSIERMLEEETPDALCLILPPERAAVIMRSLAVHQIPILLEKPPGLTVRDVEMLNEVASRHGTPVQVGFNRRFMPLLTRAQQLLADLIGPEAVWQVNYDMIRWQRTEADFSITAIHGLDASGFVARSPAAKARFHYQSLPPGVTATTVEADCASGAIVRCNFLPVAGATLERISIHGSQTSATVDLPIWGSSDKPGLLRIWQNDSLILEEHGEGGPDHVQWGFAAQMKAFLDAVRDGVPLHPSLEDAIQPVWLMESMRHGLYESSAPSLAAHAQA